MANLTTPQAATRLQIPTWLARRILDALEGQGIPVPRHGPYRIVTPELLDRMRAEVVRRDKLRPVGTGATGS